MRHRHRLSLAISLFVTLLFAAPAGAVTTLGTATVPSGSSGSAGCGSTSVVAEATDDPSTPYTVPAAGGHITRWQTNTAGATPGASVTLVVLRPEGAGMYKVLATDSESLPNPLPAGNVATFPLASPIAVSGGETFGLYSASSGTGPICFFHGGSTPPADTLTSLHAASAPAGGQDLSPDDADSPAGFALNVAVTLVSSQDAGVTASTAPAAAHPGELAQLDAAVVNNGPASGPIRVVDNVPSGLTVDSAIAGSGSCSAISQQVICTISGLAPGQGEPVAITVTPGAAGNYVNTATVAPISGADDPNAANDSASATLAVLPTSGPAAAPPPRCIVPPLRLTPFPIAVRVLGLLHCRIGHVTHVHSRAVRRGSVLRTNPGAGTFVFGRAVAIADSAGPRRVVRRRRRGSARG